MKVPKGIFTLLAFSLCLPAFGQHFSQKQVITNLGGSKSTVLVDLDGDGDVDVLSAAYYEMEFAWYENLGGGQFGPKQVIASANSPHTVFATDLDGDGDVDVLGAYWNGIAWFENLGGGLFGAAQVFSSPGFINGHDLTASDIDGDGDADVLWHFSDIVYWFENLGGGQFGSKGLLFTSSGLYAWTPVDLDGDGDVDLLSEHFLPTRIVWFENSGGGLFGPEQIIAPGPGLPTGHFPADVDGDGDIDVLAFKSGQGTIAWYENLGSGQFGPEQVIATSVGSMSSLFAADFTGNGLPDVLWTSLIGPFGGDAKLQLIENLGGGLFGPGKNVDDTLGQSWDVRVADLTGDGDLDIFCASTIGEEIVWYEQIPFADCNSNGIPDTTEILVFGADIDGDGALDECFPPPLMADVYELSMASGGVQTFTLTIPFALQKYKFFGTGSGTSPGTVRGDLWIPLNLDRYFLHTQGKANPFPFTNAHGKLTPSGEDSVATASFTLPPGYDPAMVGLTLHHAFVTFDSGYLGNGNPDFVSNAVPLALLP
jgi:hypothetical protein